MSLHPEGLTVQLPEDSSSWSKSRFEFLKLRGRPHHVDFDIGRPHGLQWLLYQLLDVGSVGEGRLSVLGNKLGCEGDCGCHLVSLPAVHRAPGDGEAVEEHPSGPRPGLGGGVELGEAGLELRHPAIRDHELRDDGDVRVLAGGGQGGEEERARVELCVLDSKTTIHVRLYLLQLRPRSAHNNLYTNISHPQ